MKGLLPKATKILKNKSANKLTSKPSLLELAEPHGNTKYIK